MLRTPNTYANKLLDPRWRKLSEEIKERDNHTCLLCGDQTNTLHVHHEEYRCEPWDVEPILLRTVCCHCHEVLHTFPNEVLKAKKVFISPGRYKIFAFTYLGVRCMLVNGSDMKVCYSLSYLDIDLLYGNKII